MTGTRAKLLVVDDDPDVAYSFTRVFRPPDYEVIEARSGEQALHMVGSAKPDVVLMDVRMPGGSGLSALMKIRRSGYKVPVVLMTAYGSMRIASEAVQAGAFDCIMKPFDVSRIRQVVSAALEQSRAQKRQATTNDRHAEAQASPTSQAPAAAADLTSGPIAGDAVFDLLFEEIARRQPIEEGLDAFDVIERHLIKRALESCRGNQSRTAKFLGITRNTLRKRIQKYGFSAGREDED
jgi:DNA-binding NtrC family response regulator